MLTLIYGLHLEWAEISNSSASTEYVLPLMNRSHVPSQCSMHSAFNGKGKRSAWKTWELCNNAVTPSLGFLSTHPFQQLQDDSTHFRNLERLVIIMYDKSSPLDSVNEARMDLFCKHNRAIENLPPTQVN